MERARGRPFRLGIILACSGAVSVSAHAAAQAESLRVEQAWVAPSGNTGSDINLYMTVKNDGDEGDALIRAACPVANFSEKRTVDVGEGGLSDRAIPNIPIAPHSTLTMTAKTFHVSLLQTRDTLAEGQTFTCNLSFRRAGAVAVEVKVSQSPPKT